MHARTTSAAAAVAMLLIPAGLMTSCWGQVDPLQRAELPKAKKMVMRLRPAAARGEAKRLPSLAELSAERLFTCLVDPVGAGPQEQPGSGGLAAWGPESREVCITGSCTLDLPGVGRERSYELFLRELVLCEGTAAPGELGVVLAPASGGGPPLWMPGLAAMTFVQARP